MTDIKTAAQALVDKLDMELIKIDHAIVIATIHGHGYDGPQFVHELNNLKTALERNKAMDELIAGDADQYDAPEWGEPFYGSEEIAKKYGSKIFDIWVDVNGWWEKPNNFGASYSLIYRLPANHKFYQSDLFKNAKKPDADHACRGGD